MRPQKKSGKNYPELGELVTRNEELVERYLSGESIKSLTQAFGIARQRIYQIVNKYKREAKPK